MASSRTASRAITDPDHGLNLWQDVLPQIGFTSPFVLHAILSISALHIAYDQPQIRHQRLQDGVNHHEKALEGFRACLSDLTESVSDAVFAFSIVNVVYIFASFGRHLGDDDTSPYQRRQRVLGCEWIHLIRGVGAVLHPIHMHVRKGPLAPLLSAGDWHDTDPDQVNADGDEKLRTLSKVWAGNPDASTYEAALLSLRRSWCVVQSISTPNSDFYVRWGYDVERSGPMMWIFLCSPEFLDLLQQRQPPALIVFAHVGILFHLLDHRWYLNSWGRDMITAANDVLGEYWQEYMSWPRTVAGI